MQASQLVGRYSVEDVGRIYTDRVDVWLPSVSTVIDVQETPEALRRWKQRNDNHKEILFYKQNFGTVAHAELLQDLADDMYADIELWSKDEEESKQSLKRVGKWERCQRELEYLKSMWELCKQVANFDYIHDVETFVVDTDIGYAGQFDLLYEDQQTGETVLADLKTSKDVYDKHLIQLSAYEMAVPMNIDRLEVIRLNPERRDWRIFPDTEWPDDPSDLQSEFIRLRAELERTHLKTIVETVQGHDSTGSDEMPEGVMYEPVSV